MNANYLIIAGDKRMQAFSKASDLFEHGKYYGLIEELSIKYKGDLTLQQGGEFIELLRQSFEKLGKGVLFIRLLSISSDNTIIKNRGEIKDYKDKYVKVISNGEEWITLDNLIKILDYLYF